MEPTKATSNFTIEAKQMQFPDPTIISSTFNKLFCNSRGENVQRRETEASDQWIWYAS